MTGPITIIDGRGPRRIDPGEFPLSIGGPDADIRLHGVPGLEPAGWFGIVEGDLFIQAGGSDQPVVCNGDPVATSQWLRPGDVIRIGAIRIRIEPAGGGLNLVVERIRERDLTRPPAIVVPKTVAAAAAGSPAVVIRPVDFRPRLTRGGRRRRRRWPRRSLVAVLAVLACAAPVWFLSTLRAVRIEIEPQPDRMVLRTGAAGFRFGGRYLLRPGRYELSAEKEGYRPLQDMIEVGGGRSQSFRYSLELLPGILVIDAGGVVGAEVRIDGEPVGRTPLDPIELPAGDHDVRISAERFLEFEQRVTIAGGGETRILKAELPPGWAAITFLSEPPGAVVRIGGRAVGKTPLTAEIGAGRHQVEYALDRYRTYRDTLEVVAGRKRILPAAVLVPADGTLTVTSAPAGAAVTVNGEYRGETPVDIQLAPDRTHAIEVSRAGHERVERRVRLEPGESRRLELDLAVIVGEIEVRSDPADAEVWAGGKPVGRTGGALRLPAVPQEIEIRKPGFEPVRTRVTPRPGIPQVVRITLQPVAASKTGKRAPATVQTSLGETLVLIEGGRLRMGAPRRQPGRRANEVEREVEITRPYYLGIHEVTNRDFRQFNSSHNSGTVGGYSLDIDEDPVVQVTWEDAALFCNWLSEREGRPAAYVRSAGRIVPAEPPTTGYRLPTEAEWALAARYSADAPLKYPWGPSMPVPPGSGNYADESASKLLSANLTGYDDTFPVTAPVDSFPPSALGLYNMGGNVAEWVQDLYGITPPGDEEIERDPQGPDEGEMHVIRGSSWMDSTVSELRLTYRDYGGDRRPDVGFRIARSAE